MSVLKYKKIGFIGAGKIAQVFIEAFLKSKTVSQDQIFVSNQTPKKLLELKEKWGVSIESSNESVVEKSDIIFLCVKPQDFSSVCQSFFSVVKPQHLIVSVLAGVSLDQIKKKIPQTKNIIRLMPNLAIQSGQGLCGCFCEEDQLKNTVTDLLEKISELFFVDSEELLAPFTVAGSSGLAFIFEIMIYWSQWLVDYGYSKKESQHILLKTFQGACSLIESKNDSMEEIQACVTSKKGVTQEGLKAFRDLDLERVFRKSFEEALKRYKQLEKES